MPRASGDEKNQILIAIADYLEENDGRPPAYTDLGMTRGMAWYFVTELENEGLVTRKRREARTLRLTEAGRAKVAELRAG